MQGHTLSNYLVIQILFKYINIVLMMILFISIFVKKYFKMILLIIIYE